MGLPIGNAVRVETVPSQRTAEGLGRRPGVVVLNPGGVPELVAMGGGLANAGLLRTYVTPVGTPDGLLPPPLRHLLPSRLRSRLQLEFKRRQLPASIRPAAVVHHAGALECGAVAAGRVPHLKSLSHRTFRLRNRWLDYRVSRMLRADDAFVGPYTASLRSLTRARGLGAPAYLECPIAHHRFSQQLLTEEASLQPAFAGTLQFHDLPRHIYRQIDAEIATAERIFVLSSFQHRSFAESGVDERKLIVTPLGVDLDLFRPLPRPDDGIFRVLFVGQITQRKGLSYLLDAFQRIPTPDTELVLAGRIVGTDAPWRGHPRVRHVAHVPRWDLPRLYASADAVVLPSLIEGFGLTALEAMACGIPVIVSEHTFGTDIVTDAHDGYVVPIRSAAAIAERVTELRERPALRQRMGAAARRRAEGFSWTRYEDQVAATMRAALGAEAQGDS